MKKYLKKLLPAFFVLFSVSAIAQSPNGVWLFTASSATKTDLINAKNTYGIKGVFMTITWATLQPVDSTTFNWITFDKRLDTINAAGLKIDVQVFTGADCPSWLFNGGLVDTFHTPADPTDIYPYYKDPDYIRLWYKMINTVIAHISTKSYAPNVLMYESAEGTTGDLTPYKGIPYNPTYIIPGADWAVFVENAWHYTDSLIQHYLNPTTQVTHLTVNSGSGGQIWPYSPITYHVPGAFSWVTANLPNTWRKAPNQGHFYQQNYETPFRDSFNNLINVIDASGLPQIRCRDEFDNHQNQTFLDHYDGWNSFYTAASALDFGVDMWNINYGDLTGKYDSAMAFFNQYAGYKDPSTAPAAFCVLHDGLDAGDSVRFPVPPFVGGSDTNNAAGRNRAISIANAFSGYGAGQDFPSGAQGSEINMRITSPRDSLDDVTWFINRDNYERYLHQIDTNSTISRWRIKKSANDTTETYGRYARGFKHSIARDSIFFDVDDDFVDIKGPDSVTIKVTYWDSGYGKWKFIYASTANKHDATFVPIVKNNTQNWLTVSFPITNGKFNNKSGHHSDFYITSKDTEDDFFAKVEVIKTGVSGLRSRVPYKPFLEMVVYPNPSFNSSFFIQLKNKAVIAQVIIYDETGQVICSKQTKESVVTINRAELKNAKGLLYIRALDVQGNEAKGKIKIL